MREWCSLFFLGFCRQHINSILPTSEIPIWDPRSLSSSRCFVVACFVLIVQHVTNSEMHGFVSLRAYQSFGRFFEATDVFSVPLGTRH